LIAATIATPAATAIALVLVIVGAALSHHHIGIFLWVLAGLSAAEGMSLTWVSEKGKPELSLVNRRNAKSS
jgi:hypothetical protein